MLHLNALYNLDYHIYCDTTIQKRRDLDERQALIEMMTASPFKQALIIADRGYESYNVMDHCQEKGWLFLIRIRDGKNSLKTSFDLPDQACFDINFSLNLTRRQIKETLNAFKDRNHYKFIPNNQTFDFLDKTWDRKSTPQWYHLDFRMVRLEVEPGLYETSVTNCDYPVDKLKSLYTRRWGIETSFRSLKYRLGMISFHAKKMEGILQEIYAHLTLFNFSNAILSTVEIRKTKGKYFYQANFTDTCYACRLYFARRISSNQLVTTINQHLSPIRPNRQKNGK